MDKNVFSWTSALTLKWKMLFIFCDLHHLFQTMDLHSCSPWILPKPLICELSWVTLRLFWPPFVCCYFVCLCILLWQSAWDLYWLEEGQVVLHKYSGVCGWCSRCKNNLLTAQQTRTLLLFPLHWLCYISPKHHLCIGFVKCRVCLVPPSLPLVSQLLVLRHPTPETLGWLLWWGSASRSFDAPTGCVIKQRSQIYC